MVEIANKKENHLGMALPKGVIRVYKNDQDGSQQFIGEDNIDHTPKDEIIKNIAQGSSFNEESRVLAVSNGEKIVGIVSTQDLLRPVYAGKSFWT